MELHDDDLWVSSTSRAPVAASLHLCIFFVAQPRPARFESAGAAALHTPSLSVLT